VDLNARDRMDWGIQSGFERAYAFRIGGFSSRIENKEKALGGLVNRELWARRWTGG
jgi:hypothetical protein